MIAARQVFKKSHARTSDAKRKNSRTPYCGAMRAMSFLQPPYILHLFCLLLHH